MKTIVLLFLVALSASSVFFTHIIPHQSIPGYAISWGCWLIFFAYLFRRSKKAALRKQREKLFSEWYRNHGHLRRF